MDQTSSICCCIINHSRLNGVKQKHLFNLLTRGNLGRTWWGMACLCSTSHLWVAQLGQRNPPSRWTTHMAARLALAVGRELNQCCDSSHMSFSTGCLSFLLAWWLGSMSECPKRARAWHFRDLLRSQMASFPPYSFSQGCHRVHSESGGGGAQTPLLYGSRVSVTWQEEEWEILQPCLENATCRRPHTL